MGNGILKIEGRPDVVMLFLAGLVGFRPWHAERGYRVSVRLCDCGARASHRSGGGWECAECRRRNLLVVHPQDLVGRFDDGEEFASARDRELAYHRIYNATRRKHKS